MAHSSYDYMFGKPALRFLMSDYMQVDGTHTLQLLTSCLVSVSAAAHMRDCSCLACCETQLEPLQLMDNAWGGLAAEVLRLLHSLLREPG